MIFTEQLKQAFNDKLTSTGSLDAAFTKAVWLAYNAGLNDGRAEAQKAHHEPTQ